MSINIEGYSQAKAEIVSTFAHGYDIVCIQETRIGPGQCRPPIHGMKLIAETRHRKYGSAVYAKPTLDIEEVHTEVTDSHIELITVRLVVLGQTMSPHPWNKSRTVAGYCNFVHAAATVWNALPVSVTSKDSLLSFEAALKTHFCALAYM